MSAPDPNSSAICVEDPALAYVRWTNSGEIISAAHYIGRMRYKHMVLSRGRLRACLRKNRAIFECPECGTPVYLACSPIKKVFFRHTHDSEACSIKTRGTLSREAIRARIYGLRRESAAHRLMKKQIARCLELDPSFSDIAVEQIMKGASSSEGWRKPDVRANVTVGQIVFEAQVNSTFIDIVQARRDFYASQNTALLWLMPKFDPKDRRLCQDDIIAQHRGTAFVIDDETVKSSLANKVFMVRRFTHDDTSGHWADTLIAVRDLHFDFKKGGVYAPTPEQEQCLRMRKLGMEVGHELYGFHQKEAKNIWDELRGLAKTRGLNLSQYGPDIQFTRLIRSVVSASRGRPFGYGFKKLIEIPHHLEQCDWYCLRTFMRVLSQVDHSDILVKQDTTGKWAVKAQYIRTNWSTWSQGYLTTEDERAAVKLMFPEYATSI